MMHTYPKKCAEGWDLVPSIKIASLAKGLVYYLCVSAVAGCWPPVATDTRIYMRREREEITRTMICCITILWRGEERRGEEGRGEERRGEGGGGGGRGGEKRGGEKRRDGQQNTF